MTGRARRTITASVACAWLAGCAALPPPVLITPEEEYEPERVQVPTPLIEYPPIEPVEPPLAQPAPAEPALPAVAPPPSIVATVPPALVAVPPAATREPSPDDLELAALLADLQRYGGLSPEDVRRELNAVTQALGRQRNDANRVRLAVLYTMTRGNPQDDQRALQLLENVAKSNPGSPSVRQLAFVLQAQITGRQRAVREEQQKADAALQKLEALRQMERSLLRDRARGGGGGGGGAGGGGSGGGSGGGGN